MRVLARSPSRTRRGPEPVLPGLRRQPRRSFRHDVWTVMADSISQSLATIESALRRLGREALLPSYCSKGVAPSMCSCRKQNLAEYLDHVIPREDDG